MILRGMLYWLRMPGDKRRPALVVSPNNRNAAAMEILVVPISSQLRFGPWHVHLSATEAGLPRTSVAKCEDVQPMHRDLFEPRPIGGPLAAARMREVETALMSALGIASTL
jgi:mRNA-degrading endonuclease toxin of MazEF toxin-antitoxin module